MMMMLIGKVDFGDEADGDSGDGDEDGSANINGRNHANGGDGIGKTDPVDDVDGGVGNSIDDGGVNGDGVFDSTVGN